MSSRKAGPPVRESDYYAFGGEIVVVNTAQEVRKFTGKKRDTESNLDYSRYRMFNSQLGRWTATDPLDGDPDKPQSLNLYTYVVNNPANLIDPDGCGWTDSGGCSASVCVTDFVEPLPTFFLPTPTRIPFAAPADGPAPRGPVNTRRRPQPKPKPRIRISPAQCKKDYEQCMAKARHERNEARFLMTVVTAIPAGLTEIGCFTAFRRVPDARVFLTCKKIERLYAAVWFGSIGGIEAHYRQQVARCEQRRTNCLK